MKIFRSLIAVLVVFILVACTPNQEMETVTVERPTVLATAVVEVADTIMPPTATSEITATLEITVTDTPIPATLTNELPTATAEPTIVPTLPAPFTNGQIAFFWDPNPVTLDVSDGPNPIPTHNLYLAIPGLSPDEWQIQTPLMDLFGWPKMLLSPDKTKLALILLHDANSNNYPDRIDIKNIYVYILSDGTLARLTDNQTHASYLGWLPDSQRIVFDQLTNLFLANVDGSLPEPITDNLTLPPIEGEEYDVIQAFAVSPDGRQVALNLVSGIGGATGGIQRTSDSLAFFDIDQGQTVPFIRDIGITLLNLKWSPDSRWLAFTRSDGRTLSVVDANTLAITELSNDSDFSYPAWSPDSHQLAFIRASSLIVWNTETFESRELATKERLSQPAWSPDGSWLATGFVENGQAGLLLIDPVNNNHQVLSQAVTPSFVSWSPDGQWLLFYGEQEGQSGLYVISSSDGVSYLVMDTSGGAVPYDITWIPNS